MLLSLLHCAIATVSILLLPFTNHFEPNEMASSKALFKSVEATKVEYRRLGRSGLRILVPILGAMSIRNPAWAPWILEEDKVSQAESRKS